jgi:protein-S-isoprenylcysteine O-methyltransferase Ste14
MTLYGWLIFALWVALVAYWFLAGLAGERHSGSRWIWWREIAVRLGFFALVVVALRVAVAGGALPDARPQLFTTSQLPGLLGFLLCLLGIGLVILARTCLESARPAASPSTDPELVTSGPYALVRHPIYGGMLLALIGSAIGESALWLLPLVVYGPQFIRSAQHEEKLLLARFPDRYPAYRRQTKMLLPFVL